MSFDPSGDRDSLSSVSTILGLALFCLLIAIILIRRGLVYHRGRAYTRDRFWAAVGVTGTATRGAENLGT